MFSGEMRTKDQIRRAVWKAMDREGVSRFPGAEGRIPNFAGAKLAAEKLAGNRLWKRAKVVKANPDSPQTHARRLALEEGKTLIMAVPRLRDQHPFRLLDPRKLSAKQVREAATIKGALRHGRVVALEEIPEIDFVLCGSVAVNLSGARIGKGGGFSDLEPPQIHEIPILERMGYA
jgi:5-formyltetrahydrofolate cyclo-ligase